MFDSMTCDQGLFSEFTGIWAISRAATGWKKRPDELGPGARSEAAAVGDAGARIVLVETLRQVQSLQDELDGSR